MKKVLTSLVVILLVICMAFAVAACGDKTDNTDTGSKDKDVNANTDETTNDTNIEATPEPSPEVVLDLNGRVIKYGAWWSLGPPTRGNSEQGDRYADKVEAMLTKYNFEFEYVNTSWDEHYSLMSSSVLAGDPFLDICLMENSFFYPGMVGMGILYPVNDLPYLDFTEKKWNKAANDSSIYKGKQYSMATGNPSPNSMFIWNKTLFEKYNLPDISELQKNKQWTWDVFLNAAQKLTLDNDGDGVNDINGFASYRIEVPFIYSNNGEVVSFDENGKPVSRLNDPNTVEALSFIADLKSKYKVWAESPDGDTNSQWGDYGSKEFGAGRLGIFAGPLWQNGNFKDVDADYGMVYCPMGPKGTEYVSVQNENNYTCMLQGVKNVDEVAFIWNIYTDPLPDAVDEYTWYESMTRDDDSLNYIIDVIQGNTLWKQNNLFLIKDLWNKLGGELFANIKNGTKSVGGALDELNPQIEQMLDDMYATAEGLQ